MVDFNKTRNIISYRNYRNALIEIRHMNNLAP